MKRLIVLTLGLLALAACNKRGQEPVKPDYDLRIEPVITKVDATNFESGDAIGLTVTRASGAYATNQKMTYDGSTFNGGLKWYEEGADEATLAAYYPYAETVPTSFTVAADQSAGTSSSDFLAATKTGVLPTANAVAMVFQHKLSRLVIKVTNNAGYTIDAMTLKGAIPTAVIASDFTATVDDKAAAADIKAYPAEATTLYAILPPQTVALVVTVNAAGKEMTQRLAEATLVAGKQYTINMIVNPADIQVVLSGDIENWGDGGEIPADDSTPPVQFEEKLSDGYFTYDNVRYDVVKLKDGKWWMAKNLRYVPAGFTVSSDLTAVTAGVFNPLVLNADGSAAQFSNDDAVVAAQGYLYQAEVALGKKVGDLQSVAEAEALEGAQGICPPGWHVPTLDDILDLVGKGAGVTTRTDAPYYDGANGSIAKLNEDGFNIAAYGAVSIANNTTAAGTFMGRMAGYDHLCSSMMCGSTYAGVTYNTSGDETSGVKNLQFHGFMPMTNKATEAEYTINGTKVSYRIAGPLRCVRNAE